LDYFNITGGKINVFLWKGAYFLCASNVCDINVKNQYLSLLIVPEIFLVLHLVISIIYSLEVKYFLLKGPLNKSYLST